MVSNLVPPNESESRKDLSVSPKNAAECEMQLQSEERACDRDSHEGARRGSKDYRKYSTEHVTMEVPDSPMGDKGASAIDARSGSKYHSNHQPRTSKVLQRARTTENVLADIGQLSEELVAKGELGNQGAAPLNLETMSKMTKSTLERIHTRLMKLSGAAKAKQEKRSACITDKVDVIEPEDKTECLPEVPEGATNALKHLHQMIQECGENELINECGEHVLKSNGANVEVFDIIDWLQKTNLGPEEDEIAQVNGSQGSQGCSPVHIRVPPGPIRQPGPLKQRVPASVRMRRRRQVKQQPASSTKSDCEPSSSESEWSDVSQGERRPDRISTEPVLPSVSFIHSTNASRRVVPRRRASQGDGSACNADMCSAEPAERLWRRHSIHGGDSKLDSNRHSRPSDSSVAPTPLPDIQDLAAERLRKEAILQGMEALAKRAGANALDAMPASFMNPQRLPRRRSWA